MALLNCLIFKIDDSLYAIDAGLVAGVENIQSFKTIPGQPKVLKGFAEIRNNLTPVINVRSHFGLAASTDPAAGSLLLLNETAGQRAYLTDGVEAITMLDFEAENDAPLILRSFTSCVRKMTMVNGKPVIFLDLPAILTEEEKKEIENFMDQLK